MSRGLRNLVAAAICAGTGLMATTGLAYAWSGGLQSCGNHFSNSGNGALSRYSYAYGGSDAQCSLGGVQMKQTVQAAFTTSGSGSTTVTLASYTAPSNAFNSSQAGEQVLFSHETVTLGSGQQGLLSVTVPSCDFQVDFVLGGVITHLGNGPNGQGFYGSRKIDGKNGPGQNVPCGTGSGGGTATPTPSPSPSPTPDSDQCTAASGLISVTYSINGGAPISDLRGHVSTGDHVAATAVVKDDCIVQLSLEAYTAGAPFFSPANADQQYIYTSATGEFGPGSHTLAVTVPSCYFQVDMINGPVVPHLTASNAFEYPILSADNGGATSCSGGGTPTPTPTATPTPTPTATPTPSATPTATPAPTATASPSASATPSGAVQGITTSTPGTPTGAVQAISTPATGAVTTALIIALALICGGAGMMAAARRRNQS